MRVAYLRYTGPFGEPLGRFWRGTVTPWLAEHGMLDCPRFGVTLDNPMNTPPEKCRYDACVELRQGMTLPDAGETLIPGGRYAVTHFTDFYDLENILILGRVTSGPGGEVILAGAREVLEVEFPELADRIAFHIPDEKDKRHGQAVAAASLPIIDSGRPKL